MASGSSPLDGVFVDLDLTVDEQSIIDAGIERLRARWPGWEPNDGDPEVVLLEVGGSFAAALGFIIKQMPPAALVAFGQKLYGIQYLPGSPATTTITITAIDNRGYTLYAGAQLEIDGYAFNVFEDTVLPSGETSLGGIRVYCAVDAAAANDLTGDLIAQLSLPSWITNVSVDVPTSEGSDPQTFGDYLNMVSSELQLRAKTIVTTRDFEIEGLAFDEAIGRIQAVGDTARLVTVTVTTAAGEVVSGPVKTALATHYEEWDLVNTDYVIQDATYSTVNVDWSGIKVPGSAYDAAAVQAAGDALLTSQVSPQNFGQVGNAGDPGNISNWVPDGKIYKNDLIALLKTIPGMLHVTNVTLSSPTTGTSVDANGNLQLPGAAPLPRPGAITGAVTS